MNSVLNPEAPEFYPHLTAVTEDGYTKVNKTIRSSNYLPVGTSLEIFKTFHDFNIVSSQMTKNLILQSNDIMNTEIPNVKLKINDDEYNTDHVIDVNDRILDRININIENVCRGEEPGPSFSSPVITKIQVGSTMFFGAKNIARPQLSFKEPVDNSDNLWVPKISDKPNNIKPLALNILYNDEGEAVGYEHPYKIELELYQPPTKVLEPDTEPPTFPKSLEDTPLSFIETVADLEKLVEHLNTVDEIAVDVEHHSYRTYQGITCLIQISTYEGDFIIDTLAVREHVHKLNLAFTDPKKLKVFHGAERDIVWLQRDFGVYVVGMIDTHQAARALALPGLSLKSLLMRYCRVDADKRYQLADWRIRPLPDELRQYARVDTHYLLYMWRRMKADLLAISSDGSLLRSVFENSRHICSLTYNKEVINESSHLKLYVRSKKSFNTRQMAALRLLYRWRDANARELDESTTYLLPNHMLLALAETLPRELQGVSALCNPMPPFLKQNLITVHRMLLSCRELPLEPVLYSSSSGVSIAMAPAPQRMIHDLSHLHYQEGETYPEVDATFVEPDLPVFQPNDAPIVSDLNVDAKMFIPPYDRYRKYRALAQVEEIKEYKDKEAKIAAISKGNELIKTEVLLKLQEAKSMIENEGKGDLKKKAEVPLEESTIKLYDSRSGGTSDGNTIERGRDRSQEGDEISRGKNDGRPDVSNQNSAQRKRKMSNAEKAEEKKREIGNEKTSSQNKGDKTKNKNKVKNQSEQTSVKPYNYKKVNYKKFHDEVERTHKQPKSKFKKHK
ncbi:PM-Scl autoantigen protein [Danaus plexippus plexippus]|uniref:Exosome complex component 10 homolog n=1 Tax=Danaus plexippus plexippus TaxID=278856 RepID=A0A212EMN4_DANPL|nr:PM-Scl autoantigen protein [Danaus plexippus plexippus]